MAANQAILDATIRHAVFLEQLKSGEVEKFGPFLKEIDRSIRDRLARADLTEYTARRLEVLLQEVDSLLLGIFDRYSEKLNLDLVDIANYEAQFEATSLTRAAPVGVSFEAAVPGAAAIRTAILSNPLSVRGVDGGKLLKSFIDGFTATERQRLTGAIRQGFFEGQTNFQIIKNIRGTKTLNYNDGILATTNRNAGAIVRTAVQHVATQARMETLKENSDVVQAVEWVSTLDSKTTPQCRTLDKHRFKLTEGPRPPIHINCRSTVVAVTRFSKLFAEGATRASIGDDGPQQVRADLSYYEWLMQQPSAFQVKAIGPSRAKLLRDGGLSVVRFNELQLDRNFSPLTLEQMKALEPLAFEKAGLI
ncbi:MULTISPECIES: minor capsid protein [unclassified Pseudomonas]|uniref:minor capsid protein n=1 Tax=unclassified Pseudomonas TaxID=196821 RepID=UPI000877172B|nr:MULTISPECIES: minor capsid protein [unclassified Pseudomonas]SCZ74112.1 phage putative head morphogenesis protein, SPP1 gp7 family [Pseudomonas sp. NFPP17]SDA81219.1 phage putative head morphogenesis protein, SPP1 gp7 family [Pseudomonas sp. NFPP15]SEL78232.1 phage putative head morphogenesis protein, SPP1 gp7 family [Pseudomonas sp. NFPP18]SFA66696.1 phage putative head morphogenesis protein, SPP1 gp7 family [Pseudomonas sp. NFPP13]SFU07871.1 phage putative head morphogenesis protein, SPP1